MSQPTPPDEALTVFKPVVLRYRSQRALLAWRGPTKIEMTSAQANNPLHGITLAKLLEHLVAHYGWDELGQRIPIRCFTHEPSINSSLRFLRKTDWARIKVEALYLSCPTKITPKDLAQDSD